MKSQTQEKYLQHICNKGLVTKLYKEHLQINNKMTNTQLKNGQICGQTIHQGGGTKGQQAQERTRNVIGHQATEITTPRKGYHRFPSEQPVMDRHTRGPPRCGIVSPVSSGGDGAQHVTLENSLAGSYKVKRARTVRPSNSIPRYLPKRNQTDVYTGMFSATLFLTATSWKQPKHPSAGERSRKLSCIRTIQNSTRNFLLKKEQTTDT